MTGQARGPSNVARGDRNHRGDRPDVRRVEPLRRPLDAVVRVPGSKSITNRALVCALLSEGTTTLSGIAPGDDTLAMLGCIRSLGASVEEVTGHSDPDGSAVAVGGTGGDLTAGPLVLDARLAGTTARFVTTLAVLGQGPYTIDGGAPLRGRPMAPLHEAVAHLGAEVVPGGAPGHLPVTVRRARDVLTDHAVVRLAGDTSSQFVTALMLIAPYLPDGLQIELTTPLVSRPYVIMTAGVMAAFGVRDVVIGDDRVTVAAGRYTATSYAIEPDASSASYAYAAAAICGGRVRVDGLHGDVLQGDVAFVDVLARMGCSLDDDGSGIAVTGTARLQGVSIDMSAMSDLVPTMAAVAIFAASPTTITGVEFIRRKESDRIGDLVCELRRCGVTAAEIDGGLRIEPSDPHPARLTTHHDHRLAMALALIGLRVPGIEIEHPGVVSKSWPAFWSMIDGLAGRST